MSAGTGSFRPGEMILELKPEMARRTPPGFAAPIMELLALLRHEHGAAKIETLWPVGVPAITDSSQSSTVDPALGFEARLRLKLRLSAGEDLDAVLRKVSAHPGVEYAEAMPDIRGPRLKAKSDEEQEDEFREEAARFPKPAAAAAASKGKPTGKIYSARLHGRWPSHCIERPEGWEELRLSNIAVLDSGCDAKHPGLAGAVDFADKESRRDGYGHGTFVAYTIVGRSEEEDTPRGMLPNSKVWAANIMDPVPFDEGDGRLQYSLDLGRYSLHLRQLAARATKRLEKIDVVNLSVGGAYESQTIKRDLQALWKSGIIVVAAAGNSTGAGKPEPVVFPAAYPTSISVGAMAYSAEGFRMWERSNSGLDYTERMTPWDLCAPGECILSALPMKSNALGVTKSGWLSGTSMAAPYVTAAVAVLCARGVKRRDNIVEELQRLGRREKQGGGFLRLVCPAAALAAGKR